MFHKKRITLGALRPVIRSLNVEMPLESEAVTITCARAGATAGHVWYTNAECWGSETKKVEWEDSAWADGEITGTVADAVAYADIVGKDGYLFIERADGQVSSGYPVSIYPLLWNAGTTAKIYYPMVGEITQFDTPVTSNTGVLAYADGIMTADCQAANDTAFGQTMFAAAVNECYVDFDMLIPAGYVYAGQFRLLDTQSGGAPTRLDLWSLNRFICGAHFTAFYTKVDGDGAIYSLATNTWYRVRLYYKIKTGETNNGEGSAHLYDVATGNLLAWGEVSDQASTTQADRIELGFESGTDGDYVAPLQFDNVKVWGR